MTMDLRATITGTTHIVGVWGDPVAHSLSPLIHNAAFGKAGLHWVYVPFRVAPEALPEAVAGLRAMQLHGVNVTVPHKVAICSHLDELSESARLIGAVNTVVNKNGRLVGHNTDGDGFVHSLRVDAGFDPRGRNILLLGAGGAARAIGVALALAGSATVDVANRTWHRAQHLSSHLQPLGSASKPLRLDDLTPDTTYGYDAVVHTSSWGMTPDDDVPPLLAPEAMHKHMLIADIVYTPRHTTLLRQAEKKGLATLPGLGMLVHQAALAYTLWTGHDAPVDMMLSVLKAELDRRKEG